MSLGFVSTQRAGRRVLRRERGACSTAFLFGLSRWLRARGRRRSPDAAPGPCRASDFVARRSGRRAACCRRRSSRRPRSSSSRSTPSVAAAEMSTATPQSGTGGYRAAGAVGSADRPQSGYEGRPGSAVDPVAGIRARQLHAIPSPSGRRRQLPESLPAVESDHHRAGGVVPRRAPLHVRGIDGGDRRGAARIPGCCSARRSTTGRCR